MKTIRHTIIVIAGICGSLLACSGPNDTKQAEFTAPNSDVHVTMTVETRGEEAVVKERSLRVSEGDKQLFSTALKDGQNGKAKVKLYKKSDKEYLLVDNNGDHYALNIRDKRFEKTDTGNLKSGSVSYVGKFDFDRQQNWRFIQSKNSAENGNESRASASLNGSARHQYGPPSKNIN